MTGSCDRRTQQISDKAFAMHQIVSAPVDFARRWWVLATVVAAQFMLGVDAFIVNVAIPTIAAELQAGAPVPSASCW
jgi:heme A synthase